MLISIRKLNEHGEDSFEHSFQVCIIKMKKHLFIGCVILLASAAICEIALTSETIPCSESIQLVGCYRDGIDWRRRPNDRLLKHERINARDPTNKNYFQNVGVSNLGVIDWWNYKTWLPKFVCECAKKAIENGDSLIGIQYFAECWTGDDNSDYDKKGKVESCFTSEYKDASKARKQCVPATGTGSVNYVYRVKPQKCKVDFKPVGCFHDSMEEPRPLPYYISNERDYTAPGWNGRLIDWTDWKKYNPEMICRCAQKAKEGGYHYFGIQFWGECWAGFKNEDYDRDGPSNNCADENYEQTCDCLSYNCVGKAKTNYVYKFV